MEGRAVEFKDRCTSITGNARVAVLCDSRTELSSVPQISTHQGPRGGGGAADLFVTKFFFVNSFRLDSVLATEGSIPGLCYKIWA